MKKKLKGIRELFWPLLEGEIEEPDLLSEKGINIKGELLKEALKYTKEFYESETERLKSIEQKSSLFIGTISVAISVLIGATTIILKSQNFSIYSFILLFFLFILILYFSRAIWFSIKALERKSYHIISVNEYLFNELDANKNKCDDIYYKRLIVSISNKTRKNFKPINEKADYMMMAQEYFKRAIILIVIYAFSTLVYYVITKII